MASMLHTGHGSGFSNFKYEPLNLSTTKPSFRLAILHAGKRENFIQVTLAPTTFADRPRYKALSYTWGRPDLVKRIQINKTLVDVRENLWSALVHLRDDTQDRGLWVDAICINQQDIKERNHQIKLMAHIYERAIVVLVWLGEFENPLLHIHRSRERGSMVETRDSSMKGDEYDMCSQPYWKRVWIVQEIGAATELRVHWGHNSSLSWDEFFERIYHSQPGNIESAAKLARQREDRHGDSFMLANLIEVCKDSQCEEPRDKIYGFVGIAHDCQDGSFPMDYSKSLFEVYEDTINFQYSLIKTHTVIRERVEDYSIANERMKTAVHFSQLIQKILGGAPKMREDLAKRNPSRSVTPFLPPGEPGKSTALLLDPFMIIGVHAGNISNIGPTISDIIGMPDSLRRWRAELATHPSNVELLRRKNADFMRVLLALNVTDLARIFSIDTYFSWKEDDKIDYIKLPHQVQDTDEREWINLHKFSIGPLNLISPKAQHDPNGTLEDSKSGSQLFLTDTGAIGLVPSSARQGDMLYQFWRSDSVAIVRKVGDWLRIVGRAVVANTYSVERSKFYEPDDKHHDFTIFNKDAKKLYLDLRTLQLMTQ